MVKFKRVYPLITFLSLGFTAFVAAYYFHHTSKQELITLGEAQNIQFYSILKNSLWDDLSPHFIELSTLNNSELRQNSTIKQIGLHIRREAKNLNVLKIELFSRQGHIIFSTETRQLGRQIDPETLAQVATDGSITSYIEHRDIINSLDGLKLDKKIVITFIHAYSKDITNAEAIFQVTTDVTDYYIDNQNSLSLIYMIIGLFFLFNYFQLFVGIKKIDNHIQDQNELINKQQEHIEFKYYYDTLTHLPKLNVFLEKLKGAMEQHINNKLLLAVLVIDLDRIQNINNTLGHKIGDKLILETSVRLRQCIRKADVVSRLGNDKFVIMLSSISVVEEIEDVIRHINETITAPFNILDTDLFVSPSIGICIFPFENDDSDTLIRKANAAMIKAKNSGKRMSHFYTQGTSKRATSQLLTENLLQYALEKEEFELHYQPIVSVGNGTVFAFEALLRWRSPQYGLIAPLDFIPLLEDTGLIIEVGKWVLEKACIDVVSWQNLGFANLKINVNVSAVQFLHNAILEQTENAISVSGIDAHLLDLEVTESLLLDCTDSTINVLDELFNMGVSLSIDDFGTGYSSLSYLKRLPINTLKIDKSFVHDVNTNIDDAAIIEAICALSRSLRFKVLAEGVETIEQLQLLRTIGVDAMQGYLFCKPIPASEVVDYLTQNRRIHHLDAAI